MARWWLTGATRASWWRPVGERLGVGLAVAEVAILVLSVAGMADKGRTVVVVPSGAYAFCGDLDDAPRNKPCMARMEALLVGRLCRPADSGAGG